MCEIIKAEWDKWILGYNIIAQNGKPVNLKNVGFKDIFVVWLNITVWTYESQRNIDRMDNNWSTKMYLNEE